MATIMSKFSQRFQDLSKMADRIGVHHKTLNKVEPKRLHWSQQTAERTETRGVESDHIRIYQVDHETSFAFAFHYSEVDTPYVLTSVKRKKVITASKSSVEKFSRNLNIFIREIQELNSKKDLDKSSLVNYFKANFITGLELDYTSESEKAIKEIEVQVKAYREKTESASLASVTLKEKIKASDKVKKAELKKLKAKLGFEEIEKKYLKAKNKIDALENKLDKDFLSENKDLYKEAQTLLSAERALNQVIEDEVRKLPKALKEKVRKHFDK